MAKLLLLALAGGMGTLCRYWLSGAAYSILGRNFPWGTWAVNILGSLLFGLVWTLADDRGLLSPQTRVIVLTGFMGAFTTFSTFMFESGELLRDAQWIRLAANLGGQNLIGLGALFVGISLGKNL